jgi:hypothetical protein
VNTFCFVGCHRRAAQKRPLCKLRTAFREMHWEMLTVPRNMIYLKRLSGLNTLPLLYPLIRLDGLSSGVELLLRLPSLPSIAR